MITKTCPICGKEFLTKIKKTKYCSEECRREKERRRAIKQWEEKKAEQQKKKKEKHIPQLDELNRRAREAGMTYGKYMAEKYKERLKNERTVL